MSNAGELVGPPPEEPRDDKQLLDELIFKQDNNIIRTVSPDGSAARSPATATTRPATENQA
jgi:hypothetical protein